MRKKVKWRILKRPFTMQVSTLYYILIIIIPRFSNFCRFILFTKLYLLELQFAKYFYAIKKIRRGSTVLVKF